MCLLFIGLTLLLCYCGLQVFRSLLDLFDCCCRICLDCTGLLCGGVSVLCLCLMLRLCTCFNILRWTFVVFYDLLCWFIAYLLLLVVYWLFALLLFVW